MDEAWIERLLSRLDSICSLAPGLSDNEVEAIEARYRFRFPPDLRALLQHRLPVSDGFPDWRHGDPEELGHRMNDPLEGVLMSIGMGFWFEGWGERPSEVIAAYELAFSQIEQVPLLIPIYGDRYLPAAPCLAGNPVFSIVQTDITYYGQDLVSYFGNEFPITPRQPDLKGIARRARPIDFWGDLAI